MEERRQADGRFALWGLVPEAQNRALRVIALEDCSGHWHTVLHGEKRQSRRMQWFQPVYVGLSSAQSTRSSA